jgi:hypothetical protein
VGQAGIGDREGRDLTDLPDMVALRVLAEPADGHILDHPLAQHLS